MLLVANGSTEEGRVDIRSVVLAAAAVAGGVYHTEDEKDAVAVKDAEDEENAMKGHAALALSVVIHAQKASEPSILVLHLQVACGLRSEVAQHSQTISEVQLQGKDGGMDHGVLLTDGMVVHEKPIAGPVRMKDGATENRIQLNDLSYIVDPVHNRLGRGGLKQDPAGSLETVNHLAIAYTVLARVLHGHFPAPDDGLHANAGDADVEDAAGGVAVAVAVGDDAALPAVADDGDGCFEGHSVSAHIRLEHHLEAVGRMVLAAAQLQASSSKPCLG